MNFIEIENEVREFWKNKKIYEKSVEMNKNKKRFVYLDGPPYTNGDIHLGHAWGKALRDAIMRYKRMQGFDVYDRPGFDMHGLPIEVEVEKTLGIKNKKEIEKYGVDRFIETCKQFALEKMYPMIEQFKFMGVWMDWDNPYMTISKEYIENIWFLLKKAYNEGLLYKDKATMTWCPRCETALAKHELEYKTVEDNSIYVKFPLRNEKDTYLIIWTTTPWTLPFNLAVMAHPDFDYIKAKVFFDDHFEYWILAEGMSVGVINAVAGRKFEIVEKFKGEELFRRKIKYYPPFHDWEESKKHDNLEYAFSVILSEKYVDLSAGSGLVHCAPGCGKEDNEVGKEFGLPAFNLVDEAGKFPNGMFEGLKAKVDDVKFIEKLKEKNLLVEIVPVEHEYASCWRCKTPIIFRATEQWYLKVSPLRELAIEENKKVKWVPSWGGEKAFNAWLENLQDWCISRQRYWGTPLPIWSCENGHVEVFGSAEELQDRAGILVEDLHKHKLDNITFKCKVCGTEMRRTPDVMDVWLDSGAAPWGVLDFVNKKDFFYEHFPVDLILEGKDQIRGWFNSLMNMSILTEKRTPYKAVYMHGMINDALGRKMSKSLKNYIYPREVFDKYGVDVFRFYSIGGAEAGENLNYNMQDVETKSRNLLIYWNIHKYLLTLLEQQKVDLSNNEEYIINHYQELSIESKYIVNLVNKSILDATNAFENYFIYKVPWILENAFLELSKTYIQSIREIVNSGSDEEKEEVIRVIAYCIDKLNIALAPLIPFISEKVYQNLKNILNYSEESIHLKKWPGVKMKIDNELINNFSNAIKIVSTIQKIRDKIKRGIRWPIKEVVFENITLNDEIEKIIKNMTNVKEIKYGKVSENYEIEEFENGKIGVNTELTKELIIEGYTREIIRRIQNERKNLGLRKTEKINLYIDSEQDINLEDLKIKTGSNSIIKEKHPKAKEIIIKEAKFFIFVEKV
ncbi:MAG: isoleucine--tRNA ligase [Candidatus Woesearchaeota archaeon]